MIGFIHKLTGKILSKRNNRIALESDEVEKVREADAKKFARLIIKATDILNDLLDKFEKTANFKPIFEVGDTAIVNKYAIGYDSSNSWDGGASVLTSLISEPIFVKITSVYVTRELASEIIDKYLDTRTINELQFQIESHSLWYDYNKWCVSHSESLGYVFKPENLGLYINVKFDILIETDMSPSWGLNEYSLLKVGTSAAKETEDLWKREVKHKKLTKLLYERKSQWDADRNTVSTIKIRNI